jgi:hypothetical protein
MKTVQSLFLFIKFNEKIFDRQGPHERAPPKENGSFTERACISQEAAARKSARHALGILCSLCQCLTLGTQFDVANAVAVLILE